MPEGPEVRRIVDQMNPAVSGKLLTNVGIFSGRYKKKIPDGYAEFAEKPQTLITEVKCKGKFIYFLTDEDWSIWSTLGMSGGWVNDEKTHKHIRLGLFFSDSSAVYYHDMRNFGTLKFVKGKDKLKAKLDSLGPDILATEVSDALFKAKLKSGPNKTLPELLMDQELVSGIGNYIKAEALYLAGLSPHRTPATMTDEEFSKLNKAVHSIIRESYESGGSTFRTYADFNGEGGNFSDRFMVYGQKTDPRGNPVKKEKTKDKRTTHWVPKVQK